MATNKHATIRYHALDNCFSNHWRKFYIEDWIEACNEALSEFSDITDGIRRRQIFDDIRFMESDQGWSIPLERIREGKRVYYRYTDKEFSVKKQAINETEAKQLRETLQILNRFKGMPQFEWVDELLVRMESISRQQSEHKPFVEFDQNPYLKGLEFFGDPFNYIQNKRVLKIKYQSFKQPKPIKYLIHPYFLKQYNGRWFLLGYTEEHGSITNLALDRMIEIKDTDDRYVENKSVNFEEYFEDVIGVTVQKDEKPQKISLFIENDRWPYIKSKPLHGSQKVKSENDKGAIIEIEVQINNELVTLIFSYGESIEVLSPESLKTKIIEKAKSLLKNY